MTKYVIKLTPRAEREAIIKKRLEAATEEDVLWDFRGDEKLKIVKLPIDLPVYRMDNCRTYSGQQDAIAKRKLDKSYFSKGQELSTVQAAQHAILADLAQNPGGSVALITDVLKAEGQRFSLLVTSTGVVVNGNRRLSAMRELYAEDGFSPNSEWAYVKCMVLPADTVADEIDDIEANEQARPETKLDYDWIGDAQLVRRQVNKGRSTKVVAEQLRRKEADVKNLLQSIDEADLYLNEWTQKPGQYSLVTGDGEQIFGDLPTRIAGHSVPLQSASRAIAWSLFDNTDKVPGRVYAYNAAFGKLAPAVLADVAEKLGLPTSSGDDDEGDDTFAVDVGGGSGEEDYSSIIAALKNPDSKEEAVETLIAACISAVERDRGQRSKGAALKALVQVHAKLAGIDLSTAGAASYPGIGKQLESIRVLTSRLEEKLAALKLSPSSKTDE